MNLLLKIFSVWFLTSICNSAFAQEWRLRKENPEIKVYSANTVDSGYNMIKVEAVMTGTINKLTSILKDVEKNKEWVYKTKYAQKLDSLNSNDFRYYAVTMLPFPLSNRDMIIRMQFLPDPSNNALTVKATGDPAARPPKKGLVRVKKFNGTWQVKQEPGNKLSIVYHLKLDSGGNIPLGVSNLFVSTGPFETFRNLSKRLRE
jgi:hypothetical protein